MALPQDLPRTLHVHNSGAVAVAKSGDVFFTDPGRITISNPAQLTHNVINTNPRLPDEHQIKADNGDLLIKLLAMVFSLEFALPPPQETQEQRFWLDVSPSIRAWRICNSITLLSLLMLALAVLTTWTDISRRVKASTTTYMLRLNCALLIAGGITRLALTRHLDPVSLGYALLMAVTLMAGAHIIYCLKRRAPAPAIDTATATDMAMATATATATATTTATATSRARTRTRTIALPTTPSQTYGSNI